MNHMLSADVFAELKMIDVNCVVVAEQRRASRRSEPTASSSVGYHVRGTNGPGDQVLL